MTESWTSPPALRVAWCAWLMIVVMKAKALRGSCWT